MLKFSDILRAEGIPVDRTRLVRHSEETPVRSAYRLWLEDIDEFDEYQALQEKVIFEPGDYVASFVKTPTGETLFVGLYEALGRSPCQAGAQCPLTKKTYQAGECHWHDMRRLQTMDSYVGKLVISWNTLTPDGEKRPSQTFAQRANKEKRVVEVLRERFLIPFPGFRGFHCNVEDVPRLPEAWRKHLREVSGIYLLVCNTTGKQYVGSAYGENGLYGRLCDYKNPGEVGHKRLVHHDKTENKGRGYQCCILDIVTPGVTVSEITTLESLWKDKLRTRDTWGLNDN